MDALAYTWEGSELFCVLGGCITVLDSATLSRTGRSARLPCDDVRCMSVSPDPSRVALGSEDGKICIFDMEARAVVYEIEAHDYAVNMVVFSSEGSRLTSASDDWTACIWDVASGERVDNTLRRFDGP